MYAIATHLEEKYKIRGQREGAGRQSGGERDNMHAQHGKSLVEIRGEGAAGHDAHFSPAGIKNFGTVTGGTLSIKDKA